MKRQEMITELNSLASEYKGYPVNLSINSHNQARLQDRLEGYKEMIRLYRIYRAYKDALTAEDITLYICTPYDNTSAEYQASIRNLVRAQEYWMKRY